MEERRFHLAVSKPRGKEDTLPRAVISDAAVGEIVALYPPRHASAHIWSRSADCCMGTCSMAAISDQGFSGLLCACALVGVRNVPIRSVEASRGLRSSNGRDFPNYTLKSSTLRGQGEGGVSCFK